MTLLNIVASISIFALTVTTVVVALVRRGAQADDLDQAFKDEEQAKALRGWKDVR